MDRRFFIHAKNIHRGYCACCGKIQLQDNYNYKKHGSICGFSDDDNFTPVREGMTYGYRWAKEGQKLRFSVCLPRLILRPGFSDRYQGGCWESVFEAELLPAQKEIEILKNETDKDFGKWIALADEGELVRIQKETDSEVIHSVFPGILDIWNLRMFVSIYRNKGYRYVPLLSEETARRLVEQGFRDVKTAGTIPTEKNEKLLYCRASLFVEKSTGSKVLRLIIASEDSLYGFLFSRKYYVYAYQGQQDLRKLFSMKMQLDVRSRKVIHNFAQAYPGYYLKEYLDTDGAGNVLIPLLAPEYHILYELLAKAGLVNVACHAELPAFNQPPEEIKNLNETFGITVSVLRRLDSEAVSERNFEIIKQVYRSDASFLDSNCLYDSMLRFLYDVDPTHVIHQYRYTAWGEQLTRQQTLRILRYLQAHPDISYPLYRDYMSLRYYENNNEFGLTPDNLRTAHDSLMNLQRRRQDMKTQEQFKLQLAKPEYQKLATDSCDEDKELFGEDEFLIRLPIHSDDLYAEGIAMHNCVRIYTDDVCRGITRIVFLRKKDDPEKSFGTIEVSADNRLIQAKAFANRHLDRQAQRFVRKWVKAKKLKLSTRDLTETAGAAN